MKKKIIITAVITVGVAICMGMIFHFSAQEGEVSDTVSRSFAEKTARFLMINFDDFDEMFRITVTDQLNIFIRKLAHFSVFFSMGALIFGTLSVWMNRFIINILVTLAICGGYACLDEYHQSFVAGRTALVTDVFIDSAGAFIGALLCFVFICAGRYLIGRYKSKRKDNSVPPSAS